MRLMAMSISGNLTPHLLGLINLSPLDFDADLQALTTQDLQSACWQKS